MNICLIGAGRIGLVHSKNIFNNKKINLKYIVDINFNSAKKLAKKYKSIPVRTVDEVLKKKDFDSVLIGSATNTHVDFIKKFSEHKTNIFCEKPIDLDIRKVISCEKFLKKNKTKFFIGFMRRFDPSLMKLKKHIESGKIGKLRMISITSRDPNPPPINYVKVSGGIFLDSQIHDIDIARWLMSENPSEVFARGSCLIDKKIGRVGDFDTVNTILKTKTGLLCQINNSRQSSYGYDQRVEAFGSRGMISTTNYRDSNLEISLKNSTNSKDNYQHFFLERYKDAFINEIDNFVDTVNKNRKASPSFKDGLTAMKIAEAAKKSAKNNKIIYLD